MTGFAPIGDGFFDQACRSAVLCEELGLGVRQPGTLRFERFGDLRVQLLTVIAQQAAVRRVLHQRVLEGIRRVGRRAALKYQLGGDKLSESALQLLLGEAAEVAQ